MNKPKLIVILGPTASGKTSLSIKIAQEFDGEIISADSRAIFRQMNIGTAKPEGERRAAVEITPEDVAEKGIHGAREVKMERLFEEKPYLVEGVPHWGIDIVDPDQDFTAAQFKRYADEKIQDIIKRGKLPILAGGTGLYIKAVVDNLTFTEVPPNEELRAELEQLSNEELLARIEKKDWSTADTIDSSNRRRLIRTLEIIETTGQDLSDQQQKGEPQYEVLQIGIEVDRDTLYERIDQRVDVMIAEGLVDEVRELKEEYGCEVNSMTGIGYRQICAFLSGYMKLHDAIDILKRDTRHYAKRQMTWFKRDSRIRWTASVEEALVWVKDFIKK